MTSPDRVLSRGDGVFPHSAYMLEDNAPEIDRNGP